MSLVRWDPLREMSELQRSINQLFDFRPGGETRAAGFPVDVYETATEVVVRADLPGVRSEDIHIQHHDGQIYIRATRRAEVPEGASWLVHQTPDGEFLRAFNVGVPIDLDGVHADYDAGVLDVRLPKSKHARPREIPVRTGAGRMERPGPVAPEGEPEATP